MRLAKRIAALLLACALPLLLAACGENTETTGKETTMPVTFYDGPNPVVTFEMEDGSVIKAELYPNKAPNTVKNFISIINSGFYDGKSFHRAVPGFIIQGGSSDGTSGGTFPYCIAGEFSNNGFAPNDLKHEPGVLSMARSSNNSASSQFFIVDGDDAASLNGGYAAFGKVIEGMDVVNRIAASPTTSPFAVGDPLRGNPMYDHEDQLVTPAVMKKVTVDTFGETFGEPVTLPPLR